MKNIKKFAATLGLLGYIIMSVSSANANTGIMILDSATPTNQTVINRMMDGLRNVVIGQITGVTVQDEGIMILDREGIMILD